MTRSERMNAEVTALLKAKNTLLWVVTKEELRVERALIDAAAAAKYEPLLWDCCRGQTDAGGKNAQNRLCDADLMLSEIESGTSRACFILRDLHKWLALSPVTLRHLRNVAKSLQSRQTYAECRAVIVLAPTGEIPPELADHTIVLDYPLPERGEIAQILQIVLTANELDPEKTLNGSREAAIDAAVGLTAEEAASCYAKSLVTSRKIDPAAISSEKQKVIARERVLTWHEPDPRGLDAVGGLDLLKDWLRVRRSALSQKARAFGLPAPKGILLVGVPGCGKSLTAKAVSAAWGLPLLRLDMGALKSKWVGESEGNIRKALQVAETVSPAVLWLDEIEKALAGSSGSGDGGVSADALGTVLSWMQERSGSVFVIATANQIESLPPELIRKGRFDELFFVDLPTRVERAAIARATLAQFGRVGLAEPANAFTPAAVDLDAIATATQGFSGAEIAALIPDALFSAFADGERELTTADLLDVASRVCPLSRTAGERIDRLRDWAKGRARFASVPEDAECGTLGRKLDL